MIHNKNIKIMILNLPGEELSAYDEIKFWLDMDWIELFDENKLERGIE